MALGHRSLPVHPAPGFGGVLLGGVAALAAVDLLRERGGAQHLARGRKTLAQLPIGDRVAAITQAARPRDLRAPAPQRTQELGCFVVHIDRISTR